MPARRRRCAAPGGAGACRCGCASCRARRSASTTASTVSPTREPAVERAAMDDQAADRPLRVGHREQLAAAARLAEDALVADLAAALGVERRPVEDDLGLAVPGQLVELHPVAHDRDARGPRRSSSRSRGTRVSPARAWIAPYSAASSACCDELRPSCPTRLRSRCSASAPLEAGAVDARRRTRRRARRSGRSGSRTCRGAGRRPRRRDAAHRPAGPRADGRRRARRRSAAMSASSSWPVPASSVRANCVSSRAMTAEDLVAPLDEVRVGLAHDVDDDRGRLGQERLAPAEQPAVADGAAEELAQDVAAALVRRAARRRR